MSARDPWRVALTFDAEHPDRPSAPGNTERVLDVLDAADVRATFFVQGRWAEAYPVLVQRIVRDGHLVGNHSHHHAPMSGLTPAGMAQDVTAAAAAIASAIGIDPRPWFRCPFGDGTADPDVLQTLAALGYQEVRWQVEGPDWEPGTDGIEMAARMVRGAIDHGDGTVILGHPWTDACLAGLPGLIEGLRLAGADLVRVDDLDTLPGAP